jgi:exopolysaccharide production protein ExoZ
VLSGVVISLTAPGKTPSEFMWARVTRLVPLYFLVSAYQMLIAGAVGGLSLKPLAATVLFWPAYGGMTTPYLGVGWTLCFEMLFYGITAAVLVRPRLGVLLALAVYALCWFGRGRFESSALQFVGHPFMLEFLAGVAIARLHRPQAASPAVGALLLALAAGLLATMVVQNADPMAVGVLSVLRGENALLLVAVLGVPAALIVLAALHFEPRLSGAISACLSRLGDASYALYLTHLLVVAGLQAVTSVMGRAPTTAAFAVVAMGASVALSVMLHERVERPMTEAIRARWSVRFGGAPRKPAQVEVGRAN